MENEKIISLKVLDTFLSFLKNLFVSKEDYDLKTQVQIVTWEDTDRARFVE